jgi:Uma2 family endonuclease
MATFPHPSYVTVEEYLNLDRTSQDVHYEYIDGHITMMSGGTIDHVAIRDNVYTILRSHLHGSPCRPYTADARVHLSETRYVYPDVVITCDDRDRGRVDIIQSPSLVVEVLSPSTEAHDRGGKFLRYRECPTIQEYVLVSSEYPLVEVFRRERNNLWVLSTFQLNDNVQLASLGIQFPVKDVYEDILFPE